MGSAAHALSRCDFNPPDARGQKACAVWDSCGGGSVPESALMQGRRRKGIRGRFKPLQQRQGQLLQRLPQPAGVGGEPELFSFLAAQR